MRVGSGPKPIALCAKTAATDSVRFGLITLAFRLLKPLWSNYRLFQKPQKRRYGTLWSLQRQTWDGCERSQWLLKHVPRSAGWWPRGRGESRPSVPLMKPTWFKWRKGWLVRYEPEFHQSLGRLDTHVHLENNFDILGNITLRGCYFLLLRLAIEKRL